MFPQEHDFRGRTKRFGLRIIRMFSRLPKKTEALRRETDELIAIFVTIVKRSKESAPTS
jgi:hypothetical protein